MTNTTKSLFVVRVRGEPYESTACPVKSEKALDMEGIFADRKQAEAFQQELESRAARSGVLGPLFGIRSVEQMRELSAFEPGVLADWMIDHDIPAPDSFSGVEHPREDRRWFEGLWAEATHWTFRDGARNRPDAEQFLKGVRRTQQDDRYLSWLLSLDRRQRAALYEALHHFRFYEIVEVPFVFGDYPQSQWEPWEHEALTLPVPAWQLRAAEARQRPVPDAPPPPTDSREDDIPI